MIQSLTRKTGASPTTTHEDPNAFLAQYEGIVPSSLRAKRIFQCTPFISFRVDRDSEWWTYKGLSNTSSEIERANDNLAKSTRMFGMPGRRESFPMPAPFARHML